MTHAAAGGATPCAWDPEVGICRTHWCWICDEDHCPPGSFVAIPTEEPTA